MFMSIFISSFIGKQQQPRFTSSHGKNRSQTIYYTIYTIQVETTLQMPHVPTLCTHYEYERLLLLHGMTLGAHGALVAAAGALLLLLLVIARCCAHDASATCPPRTDARRRRRKSSRLVGPWCGAEFISNETWVVLDLIYCRFCEFYELPRVVKLRQPQRAKRTTDRPAVCGNNNGRVRLYYL